MLSAFVPGPNGLVRSELAPGAAIPENALWLDLNTPTPAEEQLVEHTLGIDVPSLDEMREIESSNRLYEENGALHMTMTLVTQLDNDVAGVRTQVTFILTGARLVTNRYADPLPFKRFINFAETHPGSCTSAALLLTGLLEAIVNRIADVLEKVGGDIETTSATVFAHRRRPHDFRPELEQIGQGGELISKARESLVSLLRLLGFLQQSTYDSKLTADARASLRTVQRDVNALTNHATFLGEKVQFLLDATLGMVTIDQNNILKIFTVVSVVLLPPGIIASFYGMNFEYIPLLHEKWGVWASIAMMLASAWLPILYFRRKGWL
jgi:magnesium transporter